MAASQVADGVLLLYNSPAYAREASAITDHVRAFGLHSRFKVWTVNTDLGFPDGLERFHPRVIVIHWCLMGPWGWLRGTNKRFLEWLESCTSSYKIVFFQDEYHACKRRFEFIERYGINCIYTLVEPEYWKDIYLKYTNVKRLVYNVPGYVSDDLAQTARSLTLSDEARSIDIGYRGRRLPFYMGKGAQEKAWIADEFLQRAAGLNLRLDIDADENRRIYGKDWPRFMANCRGMLGVESGVSVFDVEDKVYPECERLMRENPKITFAEIHDRVLATWEDKIPYRTISPRHFEAAAFRCCQILFEGNYSGMLEPMVHYIPLKKDFSNFDEVIRMFQDKAFRRELTENAYRDLIASGAFNYSRMISEFDDELRKDGFSPDPLGSGAWQLSATLAKSHSQSWVRKVYRFARHSPFPGRPVVRALLMPFVRLYRRKFHPNLRSEL